MRFSNLVAVLLLASLAGCGKSAEDRMKSLMPPEDEQAAKSCIALLRQGKFAQIEKDLDPNFKTAKTHELMVKMAAEFPPQEPETIKVIGVNALRGPGFSQSDIVLEYQFPDTWMLANVAIRKKGNVTTIIGMGAYRLKDSVENLNKFTLSGKSAFQYIMLALTVLVPLFMLCALILCITTRMAKGKWLWILFIIIGIGSFRMNWESGQPSPSAIGRGNGNWNLQVLRLQLFGAGVSRRPYGPWTFSVSLPLGAILFLWKRKELADTSGPHAPSAEAPAGDSPPKEGPPPAPEPPEQPPNETQLKP